MNVKDEVMDEYKSKIKDKLINFRQMLQYKINTLDSQINDIDSSGIDLDLYYRFVNHITRTVLAQGKRTQEYIVLVLNQMKAVEDSYKTKEKDTTEKDTKEKGTKEKTEQQAKQPAPTPPKSTNHDDADKPDDKNSDIEDEIDEDL